MKRSIGWIFLCLLVVVGGCTRDPKEVAKKYVETGNKYYDRGKYKEASLMYRRALQKDMRNGQAHYHLGLVQLKEGMTGEARRSFMRATDLDPNNLDAFARLADIDMSVYLTDPVTYKAFLGDVKDITKTILKKDPNSYDGLRLAAFTAWVERDVKTAIEKFKAANRVKPEQPEVAVALVNALFADRQDAEAEQFAKAFIERVKTYGPMYDALYSYYARTNRTADAEQILRKKVDNNPTNGIYLRQLAFHYFLTNRKDDVNATIARLTSDTKKIPDAHMLAGDFFLQVRDFDRALDQYRQGEKGADSKTKLAYGKREVETLSLQGKADEAGKLLAELFKNNPKDSEVVAMHASKLLESRDPKLAQKAIDELQPMVAATPATQTGTLQALHFNLARAYLTKSDLQSAEQARLQLQETLRINPGFLPAKLALAELLLTRGESPKAVQTADEILKQMPNNLQAHLIRTMGLMKMGEFSQARSEVTALVQTNPKSNDARFQLALLDFQDKRFKEAAAGFEMLRAAKDPRGFDGLVDCRVAQGDYAGAIQMVEDQLRQTPDNLEYQRVLAEVQVKAGKLQDAIAGYQRLIQKNPAEAFYMRLGEIQRQAGQLDQAVASFNKAKELNPQDPIPPLQVAMLYDTSGRNDEARKAYEQVLKLQPDNPIALNNIAYSKADEGVDLDQALTYAEKARQKRPNDPDVDDTIGLIYLRKNLTDESVRILKELVARAPSRATFRLHYAMALYQKGDKAAARTELDAATKYGPTEKEKARIKELRSKIS